MLGVGPARGSCRMYIAVKIKPANEKHPRNWISTQLFGGNLQTGF
jgi:hypothetical protein